LFGVVNGAEGDVVNGTGPELAPGLVRPMQQVNVETDVV
jgi:hypothetical protein